MNLLFGKRCNRRFRFNKWCMWSRRKSQNGSPSPRWPTASLSLGKRSNTPATMMRSTCSPVSTAKPSQITDFVKRVTPRVRRLVGAGISNAGDVKKALELGADGWGVSSAFTKAKDPERILTELVAAS